MEGGDIMPRVNDVDERKNFPNDTVKKGKVAGESASSSRRIAGWRNFIEMSVLALGVGGVGFALAEFMSYNSAVYHGLGDLKGETGWAPGANFLGANDPILATFLALTTTLLMGAIYYQYAIHENESSNSRYREYSNYVKNRDFLLKSVCVCIGAAAIYFASASVAGLFNERFSEISSIGLSSNYDAIEITCAVTLFSGMATAAIGLAYSLSRDNTSKRRL